MIDPPHLTLATFEIKPNPDKPGWFFVDEVSTVTGCTIRQHVYGFEFASWMLRDRKRCYEESVRRIIDDMPAFVDPTPKPR